MSEPKSHRRSVYLPDELWDRLRDHAAIQDRSVNALIRRILAANVGIERVQHFPGIDRPDITNAVPAGLTRPLPPANPSLMGTVATGQTFNPAPKPGSRKR